MSERDAIARVDEPVTVGALVADLLDLGLAPGDTVIVHSSLGAIGWVCGGPQAVVAALQSVLTPAGTLLMPTFTGQYSDPADWEHPPVPDDWVSRIRACRPPFDPAVTPSRGMGAIPEYFRTHPDVHRSGHPLYSIAVWGADAAAIATDHALDRGLGEDSPLAEVYDRDGFVLLLGVDHAVNSSLHLAEARADVPLEPRNLEAPLLVDGDPRLVTFIECDWRTTGFREVGGAVGPDAVGTVGAASATLVSQRELVDAATEALPQYR